MKNKILIVLLILISGVIHSQSATKNLVLTYKTKGGSHLIENQYWIIPVESINTTEGKYKIYPLYLDFFSEDDFYDCLKNIPIDIFTPTTQTKYNLSNKYKNEIAEFLDVIDNESILIQSIIKKTKYPKKSKLTIEISISFVTGNFNFCSTNEGKFQSIKHKGKIVLPISNLIKDNDFLKDEDIQQFIYQTDFSLLNYFNKIW